MSVGSPGDTRAFYRADTTAARRQAGELPGTLIAPPFNNQGGPNCLEGGATMARCDVCGNDYDKAFTVTMDGEEHTFDSFECAIHALAPTCNHCGCKVIGHGVEQDGVIFCCASCAHHAGVAGLHDRVRSPR
jgi:hypothetical protein